MASVLSRLLLFLGAQQQDWLLGPRGQELSRGNRFEVTVYLELVYSAKGPSTRGTAK